MKKIFKKIANFLIKNKKVIKNEPLKDEFKTVCFFSNTAIGDTLFNTAVFRIFKENFPNVKTIVLLNPNNYKLFKNSPYIDEIILYAGRWKNFFSTVKILKNKNIDIVFILHSNEPQATPLAVLSNAKYIYKLHNDKNEFNNFHSNKPSKLIVDDYIVKFRLKILEFIGIKSSDTRMELFLDSKDYDEVDRVFKKQNDIKYIGFQMGASTVSRQWFLQRWIELANMFLKDKNFVIVLTGSLNEKKLTNELASHLNSNRILNFAGVFSIRGAAALIDRLDLLITPDTGPLHIAAALKTPTLALFVVAQPYASNPNFDKDIHKFIKKEKTCNPCVGKNCKYQKCMLQISAKEVYNKINEILKD
ncbi:glycosyltransferase family 9 protein [Campylobacter sputorum]|uniref:glycosyltransferase family 9 protein n=1 Tax=Campylobacter sputorum TaxID=206 RepID=UPI00053BDA58|nr:glycosyltransferase family 9 protein [Campylobacter sputorum]